MYTEKDDGEDGEEEAYTEVSVYTLRCIRYGVPLVAFFAPASRGISRGRHVRKVETSRVHGTGRRDKLARRHGSPYFHTCLDSMETVRGIFGVRGLVMYLDWWIEDFSTGIYI